MTSQEQFLKEIRKRLGKNESINDAISSILNISYDAAHRRVSGKSKFSIDETIKLSHYYNISLDNLYGTSGKIMVEKTIEITNLVEMLDYFKQSVHTINLLTANPNTTLYYSAKDIPLFYFMDVAIISKFKAFVWLNLLNPKKYNVTFENFVIDQSFLEIMTKAKTAYEKVNVVEIWNDTTINSSLQQIIYFYEAGLLHIKTANDLFDNLKKIITNIKEKCDKPKFSIYYNELILLNNNLLFDNDSNLTLFVPYTLLGYFITTNEESCKNVHQFFNMQIRNSKALNQSGLKEKNLFFNKALRKIEYYRQYLNNQIDLMF